MKSNIIITGHYGSGKTTISKNLAIKYSKLHKNVFAVDMDTVNPYFRLNDYRNELEKYGINLIASQFAGSNIDMPLLPADIYRIFNEKNAVNIIDVGGDEDGAYALGTLKHYFDKADYDMLYIVNTKRPLTSCVDEIVEMALNIEQASRLKLTGIVNNTNLGYLTTPEITDEGSILIKQAANILNLPIITL